MHELGFAAATIGTLLFAAGAEAQTAAPGTPSLCHDYREIARELGAKYEETPVSLGLQTNGNLLQVFASARSRTWTIVSLMPNGLACVLAAGEDWEPLEPRAVDPAV
ncbi:hypothetical protein [Benzoatithermus flavus]|uniref:Uncharacterized protein n=1 Tax=Benzoatithermus flavus TaxID=3108223 RepID=A0ABU8XPY8_9PROT